MTSATAAYSAARSSSNSEKTVRRSRAIAPAAAAFSKAPPALSSRSSASSECIKPAYAAPLGLAMVSRPICDADADFEEQLILSSPAPSTEREGQNLGTVARERL